MIVRFQRPLEHRQRHRLIVDYEDHRSRGATCGSGHMFFLARDDNPGKACLGPAGPPEVKYAREQQCAASHEAKRLARITEKR